MDKTKILKEKKKKHGWERHDREEVARGEHMDKREFCQHWGFEPVPRYEGGRRQIGGQIENISML